MDNSNQDNFQELDFLDWSEITENDRQHLQNLLYANDTNAVYPQLPWSTNQPAQCVQNEGEWIPPIYAPTSHQSVQGLVLPSPLFTCAPPILSMPGAASEEIIQETVVDCNEESEPGSAGVVSEQFQAHPPMAPGFFPNVQHNIYMNNMPGVIGMPLTFPSPPQNVYHDEDNSNRGTGRRRISGPKNSTNGKARNAENEAAAAAVSYSYLYSYPRPAAFYPASPGPATPARPELATAPLIYLYSTPSYPSYSFSTYSNPEIDKTVGLIPYGAAVPTFTPQNFTEMSPNQSYPQDATANYTDPNEMLSNNITPLPENTPENFQQNNEISYENQSEKPSEQCAIVETSEIPNENFVENNPSLNTNLPEEHNEEKINETTLNVAFSTNTTSTTTTTTSATIITTTTTTPSNNTKLWSSLFNDKSSASSIAHQTVLDKTNKTTPKSSISASNSKEEIKETTTNNSKSETSIFHPSSGPDPRLYRLGEFLREYELDYTCVPLQPRGLTNRSNWCYINSTLQALFDCPPFYNLLNSLSKHYPSGSKPSTTSSTPILDSMVQLVREFSPMNKAENEKNRTSRHNRTNGNKSSNDSDLPELTPGQAIEPYYIYTMLNNIQSDSFKVQGRQEDAEEFLSCLLNALNDEMLELIKMVEDSANKNGKTSLTNGVGTNGLDNDHNDWNNTKQNGSPPIEDDSEEWAVMGRKNKSAIIRRAEFGCTPVSKIFRGQLCSKIQRSGDQTTTNVQPFFTLQLDIEKAHSVEEALEFLGHRDQLEGMTCSKTNKAVKAWKEVSLEELPPVLLLHLKWFDYKMNGCSKIVKNVEVPIDLKIDGKILAKKMSSNSKERQYRLFAVVYHDGKEATKGHYVTDAYHVGYDCWVRYDDNIVRPIHENQVLHPKEPRVPYILYYRQRYTTSSDKTR